jgi:hypothetical protein
LPCSRECRNEQLSEVTVDDVNNNPANPMDAAEAPLRSPASTEVMPDPAPADAAVETPAKRTLLTRAAAAVLAPMIAIVAWFVPGLGHLLMRRWQRALAFFVAVGGLAVSGYWMRGNVFQPHSQDPFGTLGFLADAGSGVFYALSRVFEAAGPNVSRAVGDYGTRFIAAAGIVNVLGVCDAYEIASRRRR